MIDKTIKLTGEYPSDFKPTVPVQEVQQYFDAYGFHDGRMLGGSKMDYSEKHPDDLIIFNANVLMPGYGKVWFGDLNLTEDYKTLKKISESLNTTLYIIVPQLKYLLDLLYISHFSLYYSFLISLILFVYQLLSFMFL